MGGFDITSLMRSAQESLPELDSHAIEQRSHGDHSRILILTSGLGHGHNRAAQAIQTTLTMKSPSSEVAMLDWWSLVNADVAKFIQQLYLSLVQQHQALYERLYHTSAQAWRQAAQQQNLPHAVQELLALIKQHYDQAQWPAHPNEAYAADKTLLHLFCKLPINRKPFLAGGRLARLALMKWGWSSLVSRLIEVIESFKPSAIVSTQLIPAALVSDIKRRRQLTLPSIAVPTDWGLHDYWLMPETDLYCVAHDTLSNQSSKRGYAHTQITGFPLMPAFATDISAAAARTRLGLNAHQPIVLVLGGGLGLGVASLTKQLIHSTLGAQIVVLTGHNAQARKSLSKLMAWRRDKLRVFGWRDDMHLFMRAADIVVSKPGGATVAEALACGRPVLATQSLGGQESFNVQFLRNHGVGELFDERSLLTQLKHLVSHPEQLAALQQRAAALGRRDGAANIATTVLKLAGQRSSGAPGQRS